MFLPIKIVFYFFGLCIFYIVNYFLSLEFYNIAQSKGYNDKKYFWWSFFTSLPGFLLIVALPNKNALVSERSHDSNKTVINPVTEPTNCSDSTNNSTEVTQDSVNQDLSRLIHTPPSQQVKVFLDMCSDCSSATEIMKIWCQTPMFQLDDYSPITQKLSEQVGVERLYGPMPHDTANLLNWLRDILS